MKFLHDDDVDMTILNGKTVAVLGYGAQGRVQSLCLRDSGVQVIVGNRPGKSFDRAVADGFAPMPLTAAAERGDILHLLLPDEAMAAIYHAEIAPAVRPGKTLCCSHGFNFVFKRVVPPDGVDTIMVDPKGVATEFRKRFLAGTGVPGLIAVERDATGHARETALALAKALRLTRSGVCECTFRQETCADLFGEQNVLCGGMVDLMLAAFETLYNAGYPPEVAYFECIHEAKLIADLIFERGFRTMNEVISNTAEYGEYDNGPRILPPAELRARMRESLRRIESGEFADAWLAEAGSGAPLLRAKRDEIGRHPAEAAGANVRALFDAATEQP